MSGNQKQAATGGPQTQRFTNSPYQPIPQQTRADGGYPVTTPPGSFLPQQQPNQGANQGPGLRGIPQTGPPNQASTPPNADLKVQSLGQQQSVAHMYVNRPGQGQYYSRSATGPPSQATRMPNQHNRPQQQMYQQTAQYLQMSSVPQMFITNHIPYYNPTATQRPANFVQQPIAMFPGQMQPYSAYNQPSQTPATVNYFYNQQLVQRAGPPPQQAAAPANPTQPPLQNITMAPAPQQHSAMPRPPYNKQRRSKAIPIIDPDTGLDRLSEMYEDNSHPPSGESSARQTPQPAPPSTNKEVQAAFAKQVAQAISNDEVNMDEPEHHHATSGDHIEQPIYPPPTAVQPSTRYDHIVQSSNLKVQAKEFVSSSNTAKETPIVSANCDAVEVTLPNKQPKDRESPSKGRKQREQTIREHKDSLRESSLNKQDFTSDKQSSSIVKDDVNKQKQQQETTAQISGGGTTNVPPVVAPAVAPVKDVKEVHVREDKRNQSRKESSGKMESKVPSVEPSEPAQVALPVVQPTPAAQDTAKSKQNVSQRAKESQKQPPSSQNHQKAAPAAVVPPPQPAKANNKTHKKTELNLKGANKEGTDMDAFNDNVATEDKVNANVTTTTTTNSTANDIINANSVAPPPATNNSPVPQQSQQEVLLNSNSSDTNSKKTESNEILTIKSETTKSAAKRIDVTDIVREKPKPIKPFTAPVENQDETDRAANNNEKMVQAKNEANARVNSTKSDSNIGDIKAELPYREDQWAPDNQDGKKVYPKDFLLALRDFPASRQKPNNLPDAVIADDRARLGERYSMGGRTDFTNPPFGAGGYGGGKSSSQSRLAPKRNSQSGKVGGGGKNNKPIMKVSISVKEDVKLHETENAWRPARYNKSEVMTDEDKKTEELYKKVRGVLNKLTPQKFDTLVSQVRSLQVDTAARLQGVIDLVFEKAVDEPNFSVAYAFMCKELALMQVPTSTSTEEKKEFVNFRKLLITRCQVEFEKQSKDEASRNQKLKEIDECTDPEKKKDLQFEMEEQDRKLRMKSVGNIRFIGELFKQNMLTTNIMMRCLTNLLDNKDEESLECLCKLLTTIGKELESKQISLNGIFGSMKDIVDKKHGKVSSRVRFMLQDVIDLRASKWVPRRQDQNPKTMDQIIKEAEHEQLNIQAMNATPMTPRKDDRGGSGPNSDRKGRRNVSDDGWQMQSRNSRQTFSVQSDKLKIKAPQMDEPLGSQLLFGNWCKGSNFKPNQPQQPPLPNSNMYAALENIDSDRRPLSQRPSNKDPYSSKGPSLERNSYKQQSYDGRGSRSGSQHRSNDSSGSSSQRSTPAPVMPPPAAPKPVQAPPQQQPTTQLSEEQLERRFMNNLDEYLNDSSTVEDYEMDVKSCVPSHYLPRLVCDGCLHVLERSKTARLRTGQLFAELVKRSSLPLDSYCIGLEEILSQADDLTIDIPKFWDYLAELLVHSICEEALPLKRLCDCAKLLISQGHGSKLLASLFKLIVSERGPNFLQNVWHSSEVRLTDFIDSAQVNSFIKDNQILEFLNSGNTQIGGESQLSNEQIKNKLLKFFSSKTSFDEIVNWITANVGDGVKETGFIRALATAVFEYSISNNKLIIENLQSNYNLLQKFGDNNPTYEIQCLYALQALFNRIEHPKGLLLQICSQLYEDTIFSQESFIAWEMSTDPTEQEGKGVALKQLTCFFTQLKENDDEEEYDGSTSDEA